MINLIPLRTLFVYIAIFYGICVACFLSIMWSPETTTVNAISVAFSGAGLLNLCIFVMVYIGWKFLWKIFPVLNDLIFPDLNGNWKMKIHWIRDSRSGTVIANAFIRQDLLKISMEVLSQDSESETLLAKPERHSESGRPMLYYIYRVFPKQNNLAAGQPYDGAAILKFDQTGPISLKGNYFTNRQTKGYFELTRENQHSSKRDLP